MKLVHLIILLLFITVQTAFAFTLKNSNPGDLQLLIENNNESIKNEFSSSNNKLKELSIKGPLSKEDIHFLAEYTRNNQINKLNLSNTAFREIGFGLFENCVQLQEIYLPNTVRTIAKRAFKGCRELNRIQISKNLTSIGSEAFAECKKLNSITLYKKLSWIGDNAFEECPLENIKIKGNKEYNAKGQHIYNKTGKLIK